MHMTGVAWATMAAMNPRSPLLIGSLIVALLVAVGVLLLSRTGSGEPPAAAPSPQPTATPSATEGTPTAAPAPDDVKNTDSVSVLQMRVNDCDGCQVTAVPIGGGEQVWSATVSGGIAQLEVPTPNTLGLSFFVQGEKDGNDTLRRTLVTLQPDQIPPGDAVPRKMIRTATSAGYCWAGTTLDTATLQLRATLDSGKVTQAWADPALPTLAAQVRLGQGANKTITPACDQP